MTGAVLPVYLLLDVSASLTGVVDDLNDAVAALLTSLEGEPQVAEIARISIITFSDHAEAVLELCEIASAASRMPRITAGGGTAYGPALRLARDRIGTDLDLLRSEGRRVFRPLLLFITDGAPTDTHWYQDLDALTDPGFPARPTILAFGFSSADPTILRRLAGTQGQAFVVGRERPSTFSCSVCSEGISESLKLTTQSSTAGVRGPSLRIPDDWIDVT